MAHCPFPLTTIKKQSEVFQLTQKWRGPLLGPNTFLQISKAGTQKTAESSTSRPVRFKRPKLLTMKRFLFSLTANNKI